MKKTILALVGILCLLAAPALAEDGYKRFSVTNVDTAPAVACALNDGCAQVNAKAVCWKNLGSTGMYVRLDVHMSQGVAWSTTDEYPTAAGEERCVDPQGRYTIHRVYMKTASGTTSAWVERLR